MSKIRFGLIGSGWRAEFYIRIAKALPEMFDLAAVMIRSKEKGEAFSAKFGVKVVNRRGSTASALGCLSEISAKSAGGRTVFPAAALCILVQGNL